MKLLNTRPLSRITVKDIVEDCGVNRNSFYYHFQDIPSLLDEMIRDEINRLISEIPDEFTLEEGVGMILNDIVENRRAILHIWSSPNRGFYERNLLMACGYVIERYVDSRHHEIFVRKETEELIISFMKCEFYGQITNWLNDNMSYDIVEHARKICKLFDGCLEYVIRRSEETCSYM